jgi:hypothetical protein
MPPAGFRRLPIVTAEAIRSEYILAARIITLFYI